MMKIPMTVVTKIMTITAAATATMISNDSDDVESSLFSIPDKRTTIAR